MSSDHAVPNPLSRRDAAALIGILATLEGEVLAGEAGDDLLARLASCLRSNGCMRAGLDERAGVRMALNDLNERVRYASGEYEEPPEADDGMVHHLVGFDNEPDATRFSRTMEQLGLQAVEVSSNDQSDPVQLMVSTGEVPLSRGFELRDKQIQDAADEAGGRYIGWGGAPPPPTE